MGPSSYLIAATRIFQSFHPGAYLRQGSPASAWSIPAIPSRGLSPTDRVQPRRVRMLPRDARYSRYSGRGPISDAASLRTCSAHSAQRNGRSARAIFRLSDRGLISDRNAATEYSRHSVGVSIPAIKWPITDRQRLEREVLISDQTRRHTRRPCWPVHHFQATTSNRGRSLVRDPCHGIFRALHRRAARGGVSGPCSPGGVRTAARIEGTAGARAKPCAGG
jgi:hypothetical protein